MRLLDRYVLWSILKVTLVTLALCTLMLVGVDLFTNLDSYLQNDVSWGQILRMSGLYIPQAMLIVIGPAALFSTTYFLFDAPGEQRDDLVAQCRDSLQENPCTLSDTGAPVQHWTVRVERNIWDQMRGQA